VVGLAYWYALYPLHRRIFAGMLAGIVDRKPEPRSIAPRAEPRTPAGGLSNGT
jgi:hypothetical protein